MLANKTGQHWPSLANDCPDSITICRCLSGVGAGVSQHRKHIGWSIVSLLVDNHAQLLANHAHLLVCLLPNLANLWPNVTDYLQARLILAPAFGSFSHFGCRFRFGLDRTDQDLNLVAHNCCTMSMRTADWSHLVVDSSARRLGLCIFLSDDRMHRLVFRVGTLLSLPAHDRDDIIPNLVAQFGRERHRHLATMDVGF